MQIKSAKDMEVYKKGYLLAMEVFQLSKSFPSEEKFALTSQIRRSSRSTCLNLREAWAKRRYEAHFISKLTDCDGLRLGTPTARKAKTARRIPHWISQWIAATSQWNNTSDWLDCVRRLAGCWAA